MVNIGSCRGPPVENPCSREKVVLKRVNKNLSDKKMHALKVLMKIKMKNDRRGRYRDIEKKKTRTLKFNILPKS